MKLFSRIIFKIFLILTILAGRAATAEIKETDSDALLNQRIPEFNLNEVHTQEYLFINFQ